MAKALYNLEFENYRSVIDFIQNEKSLLFTETFNEIKKSIKNDDEMANVANLIVNDEVIVINIDKKDLIYISKLANHDMGRSYKKWVRAINRSC